MIAHSKNHTNYVPSTAQAQFEQMLPKIQSYAAMAFRDKNPELGDELTAEVVARAYVA